MPRCWFRRQWRGQKKPESRHLRSAGKVDQSSFDPRADDGLAIRSNDLYRSRFRLSQDELMRLEYLIFHAGDGQPRPISPDVNRVRVKPMKCRDLEAELAIAVAQSLALSRLTIRVDIGRCVQDDLDPQRSVYLLVSDCPGSHVIADDCDTKTATNNEAIGISMRYLHS